MTEVLRRARYVGVSYSQFGDEHFCPLCRGGNYQCRLVALLMTWQHDIVVPVAPKVAFPCFDEKRNQPWLVVKRRFFAREHHIEKRLCMRHNLLVGWQNDRILLIMRADLGSLCSLLLYSSVLYECHYLLFAPTLLVSLCHSGFFLRRSSHEVLQEVPLAIFELAILAGVQFFLYAAEGAVPDYYVKLLRFDHAGVTSYFGCRSLLSMSWVISGLKRM